jgi:site-specific recombinase XerD
MKDHIRPPIKVDVTGKKVTGNGKAHRWKLNVPASITGTDKQRLFFTTEKAAKDKRDELLSNRKGLSAQQQQELAARGMTVEDAVAYALVHAPIVADKTITKLLDEYIEHRTKEVGISPSYLRTLNSYAKKIKEAFGKEKIGDVTKPKIRFFLDALTTKGGNGPAAPDTRNHYIQTFVALFNYAIDERLLAVSPTDGIRQARGNDGAISVLSVEQAAKLLEALSLPDHAEVAAAALIQLFAAPRRSELMLIKWDIVTAQYLRLDNVKWGTTKRPVELPEALLEWLAPLRKKSGFVFAPKEVEADRDCTHIGNKREREHAIKSAVKPFEDGYAWRLEKAAKAAGFKLPKNVLRHTAITMRVNYTNDIPATARWAGTSVEKIRTNYLGKGTPEDAKRFYALKPKAGNVVAMPQGTSGESVQAAVPAIKVEGHAEKSS